MTYLERMTVERGKKKNREAIWRRLFGGVLQSLTCLCSRLWRNLKQVINRGSKQGPDSPPDDAQTIGVLVESSRRPPGRVNVQLFSLRQDPLALSIQNCLEKDLLSPLKRKNGDFQITVLEQSNTIQLDDPLLILCISPTRLQQDLEPTLRELKTFNKNQCIIIVHLGNVHALPKVSSRKRLRSEEYQALGGIYDMAFLPNKGIYKCDMNKVGSKEIVEFIKSVAAKQLREK